MKKRYALLLLIPLAMLLAQTGGNIQWTQIAAGSRHGNSTKGQTSDGTGTSGNCVKFDANGNVTDAGAACGAASSAAFSALTSATNTTATMTVGTGAAITVSGSGVNNANQINGAAAPASASLLASNSSAQLIAATAGAIAATNYAAGGGTANAQTATYSPAVASLVAGLALCWLPSNANTTTTPTFAPNGLAAETITKVGGGALAANDLVTTAIACAIYDGTGWELQNPQTGFAGTGTVASIATSSPITGGTITTTGTIACATCTVTVANGTSALGTSAISSGACASTVTTAASGVAATDNIMADFNASPLSTTGYAPTTGGILTIIKWPTSGDVNFAVCNFTAASITPGAATLNWRVTR